MTRVHPDFRSVALAMSAPMAASAPAPVPNRDSGVLRLYSGGAFQGYRELGIYPNDVMQITTSGPFGKDKQIITQQVGQGAFQAARAHVPAHPIPAKALAGKDSCDDYRAEIVEMVLPDTSVKYLATCPNARLRARYDGTMAVMTPYLPARQGRSDG